MKRKLLISCLMICCFIAVKAQITPSQTVQRMPLIEELSSSTCSPCASFNSTFDPMVATYHTDQPWTAAAQLAEVKYQMNWPDPPTGYPYDPSYNPDGLTRRSYYGCNSIPYPILDGVYNGGLNQADLDVAISTPSPMKLSATYTISGQTLTVQVKLTPYFTLATTTTKLHVAAVERSYPYTANSTTQHVFDNIMRKMLPNANGTWVGNVTDGVEQTFDLSYTFPTTAPAQGNYGLWKGMQNLTVVAFVQSTTDKSIYQAALATSPTSIDNVEQHFGINVYPNPADNYAVVVLEPKTAEHATIDVLNVLGQTVESDDLGTVYAGSQSHTINTEKLNNGIYLIKTTVGQYSNITKINVAH